MRTLLNLLLSTALLMSGATIGQAQSKAIETFTVVKVIGTIVLQNTGLSLNKGDIIKASDPIEFRTPDAMASVVSSEKGRMTLRPSGQGAVTAVKNNVLPPMSNISPRAGTAIGVDEVKAYFTGNMLLLSRIEFAVFADRFAMNDSKFFFLNFLHEGEEINKKLHFKGKSFFVDRDHISTIDGAPVRLKSELPVRLGYTDGYKNYWMAEFTLIMPDMAELAEELAAFDLDMSNADHSAEILAYLTEFYGYVEESQVRKKSSGDSGRE